MVKTTLQVSFWRTEAIQFAQYLGVLVAGILAGVLNYTLSRLNLDSQLTFIICTIVGLGLALSFWQLAGRVLNLPQNAQMRSLYADIVKYTAAHTLDSAAMREQQLKINQLTLDIQREFGSYQRMQELVQNFDITLVEVSAPTLRTEGKSVVSQILDSVEYEDSLNFNDQEIEIVHPNTRRPATV